jgi:hypothetical protein
VVFHVQFFGLVRHQGYGSIAAQGFGTGANFVRFVLDTLNLGAVNARELRMAFHRQAVTALVIFDQVLAEGFNG